MPVRYKLTDAEGYTRKGKYGETKWDKHAQTRVTNGKGDLCTHGWTHVYTHPILAEFLDPIHGQYGSCSKLISVNVSGRCKKDRGLKEGWTKVSFRSHKTRQKVSSVQVIAFGILCAIKVYKKPEFQLWAKNWLSGKDRSANAATHAAYAAHAAFYAAAYAANAANAAFYAAASAAYAANAAYAAAYAAKAAAHAASGDLNLIKLARQAMKIK